MVRSGGVRDGGAWQGVEGSRVEVMKSGGGGGVRGER